MIILQVWRFHNFLCLCCCCLLCVAYVTVFFSIFVYDSFGLLLSLLSEVSELQR